MTLTDFILLILPAGIGALATIAGVMAFRLDFTTKPHKRRVRVIKRAFQS